jgi:prevent-host-death family protein
MKSVNIHEAKTQLSALLSAVQEAREHIVICKSGLPIAELIPYKKKKRTIVKKSLQPKSISIDLTQPISEDWSVE